jgi:hypothetical protein
MTAIWIALGAVFIALIPAFLKGQKAKQDDQAKNDDSATGTSSSADGDGD